MNYKYFVSYQYQYNQRHGFGNAEVIIPFIIKNIEDIRTIRNNIASDNGFNKNNLIILNFQLLETIQSDSYDFLENIKKVHDLYPHITEKVIKDNEYGHKLIDMIIILNTEEKDYLHYLNKEEERLTNESKN